jgi:hypothetical protein
MSGPTSKSDRDRIRQRSASNRQLLDRIRKLVSEYHEGRAASSCMAEIEKAVKG